MFSSGSTAKRTLALLRPRAAPQSAARSPRARGAQTLPHSESSIPSAAASTSSPPATRARVGPSVVEQRGRARRRRARARDETAPAAGTLLRPPDPPPAAGVEWPQPRRAWMICSGYIASWISVSVPSRNCDQPRAPVRPNRVASLRHRARCRSRTRSRGRPRLGRQPIAERRARMAEPEGANGEVGQADLALVDLVDSHGRRDSAVSGTGKTIGSICRRRISSSVTPSCAAP